MSFELKTIDEKEIIEETTIKQPINTVKIWSKEQLQNTIIDLTEQIVDIESRITVLQTQLARFKKV